MAIIPYFSVHSILMACFQYSQCHIFYFSRHKWNISSLALHKTVLLCFVYLFVVVQFVFIFVGFVVCWGVFFSATENSQFLPWKRSWGCDVTSVPPAPVTRCNLPFSSSFICLCEKTRRAFREFTSHAHRRFRHRRRYTEFKPWSNSEENIFFFFLSIFFFLHSVVIATCITKTISGVFTFCISDS